MRPGELGEGELARWRELAATGCDNAFLGPGFARALDAVREDTRVAVVTDGGAPQAFLAFHARPGRRAVGLGCGLADAQGPVMAPGLGLDPAGLLRSAGLSRWDFDHLLLGDGPRAWRRWEHRAHRSPVIGLPAGLADYLGHLRVGSSSLLSTAARKRRRLEHALGPVRVQDLATAPAAEGAAALAVLRDWKSAQYLRTGQWDRFAVPWIRELLDRLLAAADDPSCRPSLVTVHAGDHLVAVHLGLATRSRLAWWFPTYDAEHARASPGVLLLLSVLERAAAEGVSAVDLGRGDEGYKDRFATDVLQVGEGFVPGVPRERAGWEIRRAAVTGRSRAPAPLKRLARATVLARDRSAVLEDAR